LVLVRKHLALAEAHCAHAAPHLAMFLARMDSCSDAFAAMIVDPYKATSWEGNRSICREGPPVDMAETEVAFAAFGRDGVLSRSHGLL
jgi:hypothetical protein